MGFRQLRKGTRKMVTEPLYFKPVIIVHPQTLIIQCLEWFPSSIDNELWRLARGYVFIEPVISVDGGDLYRVYPSSVFRSSDHMIIFWHPETNTFEIEFDDANYGYKLNEKDSLWYMNVNFPDAMVASQICRGSIERIMEIVTAMRNN